MSNKDGNSKIPQLKRQEYMYWKVKMLHHLEATDPDYLERIDDGPYVPTRIVTAATTEDGKVIAEHYVVKSKDEWTKEEKENVLKDAKVRNILFNSLDIYLTNHVIACKTAKEMWEKLRIHCQGTDRVKKNLISVLIQEYEHFEAKNGESLTEVYDRFTKLVNEMEILGKKYDYEDLNTNFMSTS